MAWFTHCATVSRSEAGLSPAERRCRAHLRLRTAATRLELTRLAHERPYALVAGALGAGLAAGLFPSFRRMLVDGLVAGARIASGLNRRG